MDKGSVEHLDMEKVIMDNFGDLNIIHKETKNMGMTYIYVIENSPRVADKEDEIKEEEIKEEEITKET